MKNGKAVNENEEHKCVAQKGKKDGLILRFSREFILTEIDDFNREVGLTRQNKPLMKLVDERGKQNKTFKGSDVKRQLGIE